jgi:hypothetical protein
MHLRHTVIASTFHDFDLHPSWKYCMHEWGRVHHFHCLYPCTLPAFSTIYPAIICNIGNDCRFFSNDDFVYRLAAYKQEPPWYCRAHMETLSSVHHTERCGGQLSLHRNLIESKDTMCFQYSNVCQLLQCVTYSSRERRTAKTRICIFTSYISLYISYI